MYLVVVKGITGLLVWPAWSGLLGAPLQKNATFCFASSIFPKTQVPLTREHKISRTHITAASPTHCYENKSPLEGLQVGPWLKNVQ